MTFKIFALLIIAVVFVLVQSKSLESTAVEPAGEMMETAETNPFMPKFAMKRLRELREQAKAQRRSNQNTLARGDSNRRRAPCPQNGYGYVGYGHGKK
ncbi:uncharacterized protein LOC125230489 isoform X2 [Leguminivora glycinivorella]|uniref:uncharacterized protein LOC125230489 isoform X2 n=1 Tax=Leguminivora glycinivorella TaxID=1035111 RepID=UPI00200BFF04|nr:uncharacterized protein LOC125230489 isoform X2 [Leguminivora glycinivorella]